MTGTVKDEAPQARNEARLRLSGLEYMRKLMGGELPPSGMTQLMNFRLVEVSEGRAVFTVKLDERHYNGLGIAHGGLAASISNARRSSHCAASRRP